MNFHLDNKRYEVLIPPNYCDDGTTFEDFEDIIFNEIIKESGYSIEYTNKLHTKLLAVRSGLGEYGRNNICYVDGMGSLLALSAYFTDFRFEADNWSEVEMMDICEECEICVSLCPTHSLSENDFVIDAGKCLTLYNEIKGEFPEWIDPQAHNTLMGCMRCQLSCPANQKPLRDYGRFEDITEEETGRILTGRVDEKMALQVKNNPKTGNNGKKETIEFKESNIM